MIVRPTHYHKLRQGLHEIIWIQVEQERNLHLLIIHWNNIKIWKNVYIDNDILMVVFPTRYTLNPHGKNVKIDCNKHLPWCHKWQHHQVCFYPKLSWKILTMYDHLQKNMKLVTNKEPTKFMPFKINKEQLFNFLICGYLHEVNHWYFDSSKDGRLNKTNMMNTKVFYYKMYILNVCKLNTQVTFSFVEDKNITS